jgi:hypothetical protein
MVFLWVPVVDGQIGLAAWLQFSAYKYWRWNSRQRLTG